MELGSLTSLFKEVTVFKEEGAPKTPTCSVISGDVLLAAQCEIPPPYRTIPFRNSIAEGGIARLCLVFIGYRASIAEIPLLWGGVSHLHFPCSVRGQCSEKGEGVLHPIGNAETPKTP